MCSDFKFSVGDSIELSGIQFTAPMRHRQDSLVVCGMTVNQLLAVCGSNVSCAVIRLDISNFRRLSFCPQPHKSLTLAKTQLSLIKCRLRCNTVLLETTTCSSQSATVLVTSLLLYVVFFDLNRFSSMSKPSSSMFS